MVVAALLTFVIADYDYAGINIALARVVDLKGDVLLLLKLANLWRDGLQIETSMIIFRIIACVVLKFSHDPSERFCIFSRKVTYLSGLLCY